MRSPYKLAPICALKRAKVVIYKKLVLPQERKFREKGASFVLAGAQDFELLLLLLLLLRILVQVNMENAHLLKLRRKLYVKIGINVEGADDRNFCFGFLLLFWCTFNPWHHLKHSGQPAT